MSDFSENFNSYLHRFLDDVWWLSSKVAELRHNKDRKYLLNDLEVKLISLLEQVRKLQEFK